MQAPSASRRRTAAAVLYSNHMSINPPTFLNSRQLDRKSALRILASVLSVALLLGAGGLVGYRYGKYQTLQPPATISNAANANGSLDGANFGVFWQAWNAIDANFFGKADAQKRLDGAISGMVSGLGDPFTDYLPPTQNKLFQSQLAGSFGGIGAELNVQNGVLIVVAPLSGSPAAGAGLKAKDVIIKIDGTDTGTLNFDDAVNKIRGPKGSVVALTIARQGTDKPFDVKVTRDIVTVKSVTTDKLGATGQIAYVKVNEFGQDTTALFQSALQNVKTAGAKGLVIDLRDNPGGYLQGAADDIGMLLPATVTSDKPMLAKRIAVQERFKDGHEQDDPAGSASVLPDLPTVILVNGGSASASEIFSGALRDYGRAKLVGSKTFGKGSAQNLFPLDNGGSVKVTIAKWFTPLGIGIDGKGLQPDETVDLAADAKPSTSDAQVQKALQLLSAQ